MSTATDLTSMLRLHPEYRGEFSRMSPASEATVQSGVPVLVVSSDEQVHSSLHQILHNHCRFRRAAGRNEALSLIHRFHPWVVVCDQTLKDGDWRDLLRDLQSESEMPPLVVSSRLADDRLWAEVLNLGGYDLLTYPFADTEVSRVVKMAANRRSKVREC
jgi:DNA-binding NtrC family response regulator